ncbi:MAG: hypothetical protein ACP5UV_06535 [Thermoplasmata archaeon]
MARYTYYIYSGIALQLVLSFVFSIAGVWYLSFIPAFFSGILMRRPIIAFLFSGVSSVIGIFVSIIYIDASYRFDQAALFSGIAGIGDGFIFPLLVTFIIMFLLGGAGASLGSSIDISKKAVFES